MSSLDKYSKMYEKMKEKPGFNQPVFIEQPTPRMAGNQVVSEIDRDMPPSTPTNAEENTAYNEELKRKILEAAAAKGKNVDPSKVVVPPTKKTPNPSSSSLEKRVEYLEEALELVIKQQIKILRG